MDYNDRWLSINFRLVCFPCLSPCWHNTGEPHVETVVSKDGKSLHQLDPWGTEDLFHIISHTEQSYLLLWKQEPQINLCFVIHWSLKWIWLPTSGDASCGVWNLYSLRGWVFCLQSRKQKYLMVGNSTEVMKSHCQGSSQDLGRSG